MIITKKSEKKCKKNPLKASLITFACKGNSITLLWKTKKLKVKKHLDESQ